MKKSNRIARKGDSASNGAQVKQSTRKPGKKRVLGETVAHAHAPASPAAAASCVWPLNQIKAVWIGEDLPAQKTDNQHAAKDYWFSHVAAHPLFDPDKEHLAVLLLNIKFKCFAWNLVGIGSLNSLTVHQREILRPAIAGAAYGIVLMHNHPSGDSTPSLDDRSVTQKIRKASEIMGITFFDHIIVGRRVSDGCFSFHADEVLAILKATE